MPDNDGQGTYAPARSSKRDLAVAILRGGLSEIPIIGGIVSEIVGELIPNQRIERLEAYVRYLSKQLQEAGPDSLEARMKQPENVDLFEDGAITATRALSDEKRERIARLVAHGISGDEKDRIEAKRLLQILAQLDDDQIIRLTSYLGRHLQDRKFHEKHDHVLVPPAVHLGAPKEDLDRAVMIELAYDELLRLGLLREHFRRPKKGELPEFDEKTGKMKRQGRDLTPLGRLLLRRLEIAGENEA